MESRVCRHSMSSIVLNRSNRILILCLTTRSRLRPRVAMRARCQFKSPALFFSFGAGSPACGAGHLFHKTLRSANNG